MDFMLYLLYIISWFWKRILKEQFGEYSYLFSSLEIIPLSSLYSKRCLA